MSGDPNARVELTPRQQRAMERYIAIYRSPKSTQQEKDDAAGQLAGYVNSALQKRS